MVTQQQLIAASNTITQLADVLEHLRDVVQSALNAKIAGVPLDQTVKDALLAEYSATKTQLATLFQQLP